MIQCFGNCSSGVCRLLLQPNRPLSWRGSQRAWLWLSLPPFLLALILALQGHLHVKEMIRWQGTTFIIGGAICGKWWRGPWYDTNEGFNLITLSGNRVAWEYIDYGWQARRPKRQ